MTSQLDDHLGTSAAARIAGVSAQRIRQLVSEGKLPAMQTPLGALIPKSAAEQLAAERAARPKSERK